MATNALEETTPRSRSLARRRPGIRARHGGNPETYGAMPATGYIRQSQLNSRDFPVLFSDALAQGEGRDFPQARQAGAAHHRVARRRHPRVAPTLSIVTWQSSPITFAAATLSSRMPACSVIIRNPGSNLLEGRTMLELRRSSIVTPVETAATRVLHRDYETRSRLDLRKVGAQVCGGSHRQKFCARHTPSTMDPCSCGGLAIRSRRNSSKLQRIRAGLSARTTMQFEIAIEQHVLRSVSAGR